MKWLVLSVLTAYSFLFLPGHTWLQSDTQIYAPMFDRIADPTLFEHELVAQRQHVSLTIYDEVAIACRKAGISYRYSLATIQILTRFAALYGLFLMGTAFGLTEWTALLLPVLAGFGAVIQGPAVLTFEYEPVPRGFSVALTFLAMGFAMHGRGTAAALAAGIAFLFHAPAAVPFLIPFVWLQWREKNRRALAYAGGAVVLAALLSLLQAGSVEPQRFFALVDPEWEKLQRMRASYNWLSTWKPWFFVEFLLHGAIVAAASARLWRHLGVRPRLYIVSMTCIGLLSLPLAWYLMEDLKWLLMSQIQPARSVLYTVELSFVLSAAAGLFAIRDRRWWEAPLWFFPPLFVAVHRFLANTPYPATHVYCALALVAAACVTAYLLSRPSTPTASTLATPIALAALMGWLLFDVTGQTNYDLKLHSAELDDISRWARENTPKGALFQLPEFSRSLISGIFRVNAQRALFVDWKIGGQVNYSRDLTFEWWRRMQIADDKAKPLASWKDQGVDYLILKSGARLEGSKPIYQNAKYAIHELRTLESGEQQLKADRR